MEEIDRARHFIAAVKWLSAKTYEKTAPHQYTVRKWLQEYENGLELDQEYAWFTTYIKEAGYKAKFFKSTYTYLNVDDYRYWTMWEPHGRISLINRCPVNDIVGKEQPNDMSLESMKQEDIKTLTDLA